MDGFGIITAAPPEPTFNKEKNMKVAYFQQEAADADDMMLGMAKIQGYVPQGCLLGGMVVMAEVQSGKSPCDGCNCPRSLCGGKPKAY